MCSGRLRLLYAPLTPGYFCHMPPSESNVPGYLREIFQSLEVGVLVADDDGTYVDANRAACHLLRRERSEIVGHNVREFTAPDMREQLEIIWDEFLRTGEYHGLFPLLMPDGSYRELEFNARARCAPGRHFTFVGEPVASAATPSDGSPLTLCAWTNRVKLGEEWIPIEEYLLRVHGVRVSHGMSPDAFPTVAGEV